ncbi:hypothetical protein H6P81_012734 [Aristolochia fimbriata]|uniref:Uncharacterized protein n=1 Tax=Aristolochia fimbriata TaxID=158543 RepID=A0AAV7EFJ3_ARIFI|nr:hypothetical protein H6P81_012734 [Aristolochia fimbriata]
MEAWAVGPLKILKDEDPAARGFSGEHVEMQYQLKTNDTNTEKRCNDPVSSILVGTLLTIDVDITFLQWAG